jgi:hypothetical protein
MPRPLRKALFLLLLPALCACSLIGLSAQQDADLRAVFDRVRAGDLAGVEAAFDPQYRTPALVQGLPLMKTQIPAGAAKGRLLKGVVEKDKQGRVNYGGIYEYDFPQEAILAQVEMRQDAAGHKAIVGFHLQQAAPHVADAYGFGLTGKKYYQYAFLVLVALSPILGVWGLVALWRAPDIKWKILWVAAMLIGFMDLTMDWTTGDVVLNVVDIHVLWLKAARFGPLSPWMITTSLPLASIAFLLGYRPPRIARPWDPPKG